MKKHITTLNNFFQDININKLKKITYILLYFTFLSCQSEHKKEIIQKETTNIENIEDPEADNFFLSKFSKFTTNTLELYDLDTSDLTNENSSLNSESNIIDKQIHFRFQLYTDSYRYFIINSLYEVKDEKYIKINWDTLQSGIWKGLDKTTKKSDFTYYRNNKLNKIGNESEFSEIPVKGVKDQVMIIYQIRLGKYILQYGQIINSKRKEELIAKIKQNINRLKSL